MFTLASLLTLACTSKATDDTATDDTATDDTDADTDGDADGDGYSADGGDCDDDEAAVNPGADEVCGDGIDNDCDSETDCAPESANLSTAITYTGESNGDFAGSSVSGAGDVNGDGLDDLMVGANYNADGPGGAGGAAYLVLGTAFPSSAPLSAAVQYTGEMAGNFAGWAVAAAGDVDADGLGDMLVGAPNSTDGGGQQFGAAYLIFGSATPSSANLSEAVEYSGEFTDDFAGYAVSGAGDVDGDGHADILVGVNQLGDEGSGSDTGRAYLVLGSGAPGAASLSTAVQYIADVRADGSGRSVADGGDVNADGLSDILVGAPFHMHGGSSAGEGSAFLVLGTTLPTSAVLSTGFVYDGEVTAGAPAYAGWSVSGAGDTDGDGYGDLLVGAPGNDDAGSYAGAAYLVLGSSAPASASLSGAIEFMGEVATDYAGSTVSGAGDVNCDGLDDLLVGAPLSNDGGHYSGAAYLVLGTTAPASSSLSAAVQYTGGAEEDSAGVVAGAGDVDGNGCADVLVGFDRTSGRYDPGAAYLLLGDGF